ncbi:MAG: GNAT family protein [Oscillospiraceae bacterium]|nr:GNAT family protein [Oscillospiraceae bacterium]
MEIKIKTKRLLLRPLTDEALAARRDAETDAHMKKAYGEMLDGCLRAPKDRLWFTEWSIELKTGECIGGFCFKGPAVNGEAEIGYEIAEAQRRQGYAFEAIHAAMEWAYGCDGVYFVSAETEPGNTPSQKLIEKLGFTPDGVGAEGPRYIREKEPSAWMSVYMCLGMGVGLCFGTALGNLTLGMCCGMPLGVAVGLALDAQDKRKRESLRAAREAAKKER